MSRIYTVNYHNGFDASLKMGTFMLLVYIYFKDMYTYVDTGCY